MALNVRFLDKNIQKSYCFKSLKFIRKKMKWKKNTIILIMFRWMLYNDKKKLSLVT